MELATIIPPRNTGKGPTVTQGTKVVLSDGSELKGITRIEIQANANDVWRARIDCYIKPAIVKDALLEVRQSAGVPFSWWRKALLRLAGIDAASITTLDSREIEWRTLRSRERLSESEQA